jgi:hypothetical protein
MNHDWLLFLIMAQLLLVDREKKLKQGDWKAVIDFVFGLLLLIGGVVHLLGWAHD